MKLKTPAYSAVLRIDNKLFSYELVRFFYQKDPFPGGHTYNLIILGLDKLSFLDLFRPGVYETLDNNLSMTAIFRLNILLERLSFSEDTKILEPKFFLNSIQRLEVANSNVSLSGICSEVQH